MKNSKKLVLMLAVVLAVLTVVAGVVVHAAEVDSEQEVEKVKRVKVVKKGACEGEDCPHAERHRIIIKKGDNVHHMMSGACEGDCLKQIVIKEAGDTSRVHLLGSHHVEIEIEDCDGEDCKQVRRIFINEEGDPSEMHAASGEDFDWVEAECEGEDCRKMRKVIVKKGGEPVEIHALGGHDFDWTSDECEGGDCEQRRVVVKKIGGPHGHSMAFLGDEGYRGGFLGVQLTELTPELRAHFGVSADHGVMIGKVLDESAAAGAGLVVGDIVSSVNGDTVSSAAKMSALIGKMEPGETVTLGVWRDGAPMDVSAVLGKSKRSPAGAMREVVVLCDEDDEDCEVQMGGTAMDFDVDFDCGDADECEVEIECEEECTCRVNGDSVDCDELGLPEHFGHN